MLLFNLILAAQIIVNPFIGASTSIGEAGIYHGLGKTYPGATAPFGMAQANPQTITGGDNAPGYSYEHKTIEGFAMMSLSGAGWFGEMGNLLTMPTTGTLNLHAGVEGVSDGWRSYYDKGSERASAGYYSVRLTDYDILAECTASHHCSVMRFTYPRSDTSRIQIDFARRVGGRSDEQYVEVVGRNAIRGWVKCTPKGGGWGHGDGNVSYTLYFYSTFSKPLKNYGFWDGEQVLRGRKSVCGERTGFFTEFKTSEGEAVTMKTALSFVDLEGARKNYMAEAHRKSFERIYEGTAAQWDKVLSVIEVETPDKDVKTVFYTALYHTCLDPRDITDVDGRYWSADGIHGKTAFTKRSVFSGWDVFRSQFPLQTIINPSLVSDMINSLSTLAEDSGRGYLERWEMLNAYSGCMLGNPALSVIADAYAKGIRDFDAEKVYAQMKLSSEKFRGVPWSISETLEYSYFDWCLGEFADALGKSEDAAFYKAESLRYRDLFNPEVGWFQPKDAEGNWILYPERGRLTQDFACVESNPYQQGWFVPHDWDAFVEMLGGREAVIRDLSYMFENTPRDYSWNDYYNHANEPVHFIPFLFNRLGRADLTQYWTRDICRNAYHNGVKGLVGNEDVGQMSAWYILASIGIHPVCPGIPEYEITSPVFSKVVIHLPDGKTFTIVAKDNSEENVYIDRMTLDGKPYTRHSIDHSTIMGGGVLELQMKSK